MSRVDISHVHVMSDDSGRPREVLGKKGRGADGTYGWKKRIMLQLFNLRCTSTSYNRFYHARLLKNYSQSLNRYALTKLQWSKWTVECGKHQRSIYASHFNIKFFKNLENGSACYSTIPQCVNKARVEPTTAANHIDNKINHVEDNVTDNINSVTDLKRLELINASLFHALKDDMKFEELTLIQKLVIAKILRGQTDLVGQAKTGTGKTLAFLIPCLQRILHELPHLEHRSRYSKHAGTATSMFDTRALIISPTRELAEQIGAEARRLAGRTNIRVQLAVGGTMKRKALADMKREGCHVLIATPGRLLDLLSLDYFGIEVPKLNTFVLDEADNLLNQGFLPDLLEIWKRLPNPKSQPRKNLLFSATMPDEVIQLIRRTINTNFDIVKTVSETDAPTHERVEQKLVVTNGLENIMPSLWELCTREVLKRKTDKYPFKAIVFFNTKAEISLGHMIFKKMRQLQRNGKSNGEQQHALDSVELFELHGKLTQQRRTDASTRFRNAQSAILFSSDVAARGIDFPNVTHVIQLLAPRDRDTYIHRIGRTARAGKDGESWLIVPRAYVNEMCHITSMPLKRDLSLELAKVDMSVAQTLPTEQARILQLATTAARIVPPELLDEAYNSALGALSQVQASKLPGLVESLNQLTRRAWGMTSPPSISRSRAARLGMLDIPCMNIRNDTRKRFNAGTAGTKMKKYDQRTNDVEFARSTISSHRTSMKPWKQRSGYASRERRQGQSQFTLHNTRQNREEITTHKSVNGYQH